MSTDARKSPARITGAPKFAAVAYSGAAIVSLVPVLLFQLKTIKRLPDPPGTMFESERIVLSKKAFPLGIPDAALGLVSYGTTMALLLANSPSNPGIREALEAKLLLDGVLATTNTVRQFVQFRKVCSWCMGTVLSTAGMLYCWHRARGTVPRTKWADWRVR